MHNILKQPTKIKVNLITAVFSLVILTLLHFLWISSNHTRYNDMVNHITKSSITLNYFGVIITYVLLYVGLITFVIPNINFISTINLLISSLHYGGILGIVIYGINSIINFSIFKLYDVNIAILDAIWGTILYILTSIIVCYFFHFEN